MLCPLLDSCIHESRFLSTFDQNIYQILGRYGLYAPSRGGLDMLDLRHGTVLRTLIPKIAEGIFTVICKFNATNEYVLYECYTEIGQSVKIW